MIHRRYSFYICARYGRRQEAESIASSLNTMGHTITSSWLWQPADEMFGNDTKLMAKAARKDLNEVHAADILLYLSEPEENVWGRGGRHVEFGAALALDKVIYVIGPQENLFHYLPSVSHFDSFDDLMEYLVENDA